MLWCLLACPRGQRAELHLCQYIEKEGEILELTLLSGISGGILKTRLAELGGARNVCSQVDFSNNFLHLAASSRAHVDLARDVGC